MERFVWICVGGALGTGVRYLIAIGTGKLFGTTFPYGTLLVNLAGCFLMAAVMHVALTTTLLPPKLWPILTTGFLGGLTTYSSFNFETTTLLEQRGYGPALLNFGLTTIGCFGAGLLGLFFARRLLES